MTTTTEGTVNQALYYDNSMLSSYKDCPRKYYLRHELGWRSEGTSLPLVFGLSWHSGQDALWTFAKKGATPEELLQLAMSNFLETWESQGMSSELDVAQLTTMAPRTPGIAKEMYANYMAARWKMLTTAELLACEQPFAVPLADTDGRWYAGRLDKVVRYNGETVVLEHKTTTAYSTTSTFQNSYVDSWYSDAQCKGYQYGGSLYFEGLQQVWVDAALVHKKIHDGFRFIPVAHQFPLLTEWLRDTAEWIQRVESDRQALSDGLPGAFPKNENHCFGKYGSCTFLNVCRTVSEPWLLDSPPAGYMVEFWKPFELLGLDKLINNSGNNEGNKNG